MSTTKYMKLYSLVKDNMYIQRVYITSRQLHVFTIQRLWYPHHIKVSTAVCSLHQVCDFCSIVTPHTLGVCTKCCCHIHSMTSYIIKA